MTSFGASAKTEFRSVFNVKLVWWSLVRWVICGDTGVLLTVLKRIQHYTFLTHSVEGFHTASIALH